MMPSELNRICRSAEAIGPFGSSTPSLQPPSVAAPIKTTASSLYRMSNLVCRDAGKVEYGSNRAAHKLGRRRATASPCTRPKRRSTVAGVRQEDRKQHEQEI